MVIRFIKLIDNDNGCIYAVACKYADSYAERNKFLNVGDELVDMDIACGICSQKSYRATNNLVKSVVIPSDGIFNIVQTHERFNSVVSTLQYVLELAGLNDSKIEVMNVEDYDANKPTFIFSKESRLILKFKISVEDSGNILSEVYADTSVNLFNNMKKEIARNEVQMYNI